MNKQKDLKMLKEDGSINAETYNKALIMFMLARHNEEMNTLVKRYSHRKALG